MLAASSCGDDSANGDAGGPAPGTTAVGGRSADAAASGGDASSAGDAGDGQGLVRAPGYVPIASVADELAKFGETIDACATRTQANPGATVYYVAIDEPGADNDACDGLAPSDEGGGRCPFRDFESPRMRELLVGVKNTRLEIRAGHYGLVPSQPFRTPTEEDPFVASGIHIEASGTSDAERVVLTNYAGEDVVLDGEGHIRETVVLSGRYTLLEGLTVVNGGGYSVEVRGGDHHRVRCNQIGWSGSDALKGDGGAADSEIVSNEFSDWSSQAIDNTDVHGWRIEGNVFHDPRLEDANATGAKYGCTDVLYTGNVFHHTRGLSMGGTSSEHDDAFEAMRIVARGNVFHDVVGVVAKLYSCIDCEFVENDVSDTDGGVYFQGGDEAGTSGCPGGCGPSRGGHVAKNRFKRLRGSGGGEGDANTFVWLSRSETDGFTAEANVYCVPPGGEAHFGVGEPMDFAGWQAATGTDADSAVHIDTDAACQGW